MLASKVFAAIAGASALTIALAGTVAADVTVGQTGHYIYVDSSSKPEATCKYSQSGSTDTLYAITVRPPEVWWPNTTTASNTEHGTVGWQVVVRHKRPSATSWSFLKQSSVQKATAYEDHPAYDLADKAPFTKISLSVSGASFAHDEQFRVNAKAYWYTSGGSIKGYTIHVVQFYATKVGTTIEGVNQFGAFCYAQFFTF